MKLINNLSVYAIPIFILLIVGYGFIKKNNVFDNFVDGAKEGGKIVINLFPTLLGLFVAIGVLRASGILELLTYFIKPIIKIFNLPEEIMPLVFLKPISGSGALAIATDIMKNYGVDTKIGKMASCIMGSTETTIYIIAIYTSCIKIKKTRGIIYVALAADLVSIIISILICNFM